MSCNASPSQEVQLLSALSLRAVLAVGAFLTQARATIFFTLVTTHVPFHRGLGHLELSVTPFLIVPSKVQLAYLPPPITKRSSLR